MLRLSECQKTSSRLGIREPGHFRPKKEEFVLIRRFHAMGPEFRLLGVVFDPQLLMHKGVRTIATEAGWRLSALLRPRKFFTTPELMKLYKAHVLSYIESGTAAYFHASESVLSRVDGVQRRFLRELEMSEEDALLRFRLAPLRLRREIGILGLLHRVNLGQTSGQITALFPRVGQRESRTHNLRVRYHDHQLHDRVDNHSSSLFKRSIFGMVSCYNALPQRFVEAPSVKPFQSGLQRAIMKLASGGHDGWQEVFAIGRRYGSTRQFQRLFE